MILFSRVNTTWKLHKFDTNTRFEHLTIVPPFGKGGKRRMVKNLTNLTIIQGFIGWFILTIFSVSLISQLLN